MNCEFCKKPLRFSHHENNKEVEVYDCYHCPVQISFSFFHKDGSSFKSTFFINKNERLYSWTNNFLTGLSYITDVGGTFGPSTKDPVLIRFPKIMNINPDNIHEKFSFYMVFL
jgi:hypothetical protein